MDASDAWNWCWADPRCLAFPTALFASLAAVARRVDVCGSKIRRGQGCLSIFRSCFAGATIAGLSAFALELGVGSLCTTKLEVVTMAVLLTAVAIDFSAESASGFMRSWLLTILEAYLRTLGIKLERIAQPASRPKFPDESNELQPPPSRGGSGQS